MRWLLGLVFLCVVFPGVVEAQEGYAFAPEKEGVVVLRNLRLEENALYLAVSTRGCTTKEDIVARVEEKGTVDEGIPHYAITFVREIPDTCSGEVTESILIYDLRDDLHLEFPCAISVTNPVVFRGQSEDGESLFSLRRELQKATIWAIMAEIARYEESERPDREEKIALLRGELERIQCLSPEEYPLPQENATEKDFGVLLPPLIRRVEVTSPPRNLGAILEVKGMTRSGPFFHVAGIQGGDFSVFRDTPYRLTLYLVYRREYFARIPDYYVYIASWEECAKNP